MLENAKDSNILGYVHEFISGMSFRSWKCNLQKKKTNMQPYFMIRKSLYRERKI